MIDSKRLMELTGISRATLNNYISLGILPVPEVRAAGDHGRAVRIGYFPENAVQQVEQVQQLKKSGMSIAEIAEQLKAGVEPRKHASHPASKSTDEEKAMQVKPKEIKPETAQTPLKLELSIENFPGPAYMVNNNFELVWWNEQALTEILDLEEKIPGEITARNLLTLLLANMRKQISPLFSDRFEEMLSPHITAAKRVMSKKALVSFYSNLNHDEFEKVENLYNEAMEVDKEAILHFPTSLLDSNGKPVPANLFVCFFQEGILFTYSHVNYDDNFIIGLLSRRNEVIGQILRKRKPYLSNVVALVADLQGSVQICSQLPAEEYFELINNIWQESEPVFRKYFGTYGKHAGDGMVYFFFPQPDSDYKLNAILCSLELKEIMRKLTSRWQSRKGWFDELFLNIGIHEGQEWFGAFHAGSHLEFTVLGETINHAARLSDFARKGQILVTKSMLNQFETEFRRNLHFGIKRRTGDGQMMFVADTYATIHNLAREYQQENPKFRDIEMLPVTEIRDYRVR